MPSTYLLFEYLSLLNLPLAVLAKLVGVKVRYLRNANILDRYYGGLSRLGILGLEFSDFPGFQADFYSRLAGVSKNVVQTMVLTSNFYKLFTESVTDARTLQKFEQAFRNQMANELREFSELAYFALRYKAANPNSYIVLWAKKSWLRKFHTQWDGSAYRTWAFPLLREAVTLLALGLKVAGKFHLKFKKVFQTPSSPDSAGNGPARIHAENVIYFPHKGIFYGTFFVKDHYYSADLTSAYHPSKILHLSLGEGKELLSTSFEFYKNNSIPFADLLDFRSVRSWTLAQRFLRFMWKSPVATIKELVKNGPDFLSFFFRNYKELQIYISSLRALPNAKVALIGFEIVFPNWLAVALSHCNIKTVASQERMISAYLEVHLPPLDYYFTIGKSSTQHLRNNSDLRFSKLIPLGLVRSNLIQNENGRFQDDKYELIRKNFEKIVLCLDFHSVKNPQQNRLAYGNSWKVNRKFYEDLLILSERFPKVFFVIKGKGHEFLEIPYFAATAAALKTRANLSIETDYGRYPPEKMAALADVALGLYTSLHDEILASGKPTIIYDYAGFPSCFYDYDRLPFIAKDIDSLLKMLAQGLNQKQVLTDEELQQLQDRHYENSVGSKVRERLQDLLQQICPD